MRHWQFFLPRTFLMTNRMLKALRSAGHYEGARGARPKRGYGYDKYSCEVASIKSDVRHMIRSYVKPTGEEIHRLDFYFVFVGHEDFDGDAGLLPSKAMVDGICRELGFTSDRLPVRRVTTWNCISSEESSLEWSAYLAMSTLRCQTQAFGPGCIVYLQEVP